MTTRRASPQRTKKISRPGILGQKGVNLVEKIVLEMGSRWTASGPNEVGIDGYIELFDPNTNSPLGKTLAVQSKALSSFSNETDEYFDYWCNRRDIDYWLQGNVPVILIVSRPATNEAYWVCIKDYFARPEQLSSTKIRFSKSSQRFNVEGFEELVKIGRSPEIGFYLAPVPRNERLYSNLLPLEQFPPKIWIASTTCRKASDVWSNIKDRGEHVDGAWILREKNILSFHNLGESPWSSICDLGTLDGFDSNEWADSNDPDKYRQFVQLLNQTLRSQLYPRVRYWPNEDCYAYVGSLEEGSKKASYRSAKRKSKVTVVSIYTKTNEDGRIFVWLRHLAFRGQFRRFEGQWYLEITPTYRFTRDGYILERFHEDRLKGIKRIEGNRAVLSAVLFWADHLRVKSDLFLKQNVPLIFGDLLTFNVNVGINDGQWSAQNQQAILEEPESDEGFLQLFDN